MQTLLIILILFLFINLLFLYEYKAKIKRLRESIKSQYGKKPTKNSFDGEKVSYYWSELVDSISNDEKIDDVTWNDLEMDKVFCRINNCNSFVGEQLLYSTLHRLKKSNSYRDLLERKICFFEQNEIEREGIQLLLSSIGKDAGSYYLPLFMNNLDAFRIPGIWIYRIMQLLLILSFLPVIVLQNTKYIFVPICIFLINMVIYAMNKIKYDVFLDTLNCIIGLVKVGSKITDTNKFLYENEFQDLKKEVNQFNKLNHMIGKMQRSRDANLSGSIEALIYDYLIGATLIDFVKYDHIMRGLKGKQSEFIELFKTIGEIDMAISIASFRESLPLYCTPTFCEDQALHIHEIYHPLIDEPVCNTVDIERNCIITGSNASGKSTFIKAVSINTILAQSINTCMAKQMTLPYASIITSMAVRDDLMAGESYYIKEIKYLNRIIQNLSDERLVICTIDEILRGTNTEERIAASAAILKYLSNKNCIAIVASHDIELTKILNGIYENFHFCEKIMENDIVFDYKIHEGITTSKNAIRLLEYVNFPKEIIEDAIKSFLLERNHCL